MCGIAGIILKKNNVLNISEKISGMSQSLSHRGPDGEGITLADEKGVIPYFNH